MAPVAAAAPLAGARVKASPLAKKVAAQRGVDLKVVQGSGPGGRIIRRDVEAATTAPAAAPAVARALPGVTGPEYEDRPLTQIRATIAKRMPLSKAPVPHFYVTSEVAMDRAWALREELNALDGAPKISVNDLVIRACALALLQHPEVNASFQGDSVRVWHRAHIGIAVALEEGLITPVLRDCQAKSMGQIAVESRDLAERTRARKLKAHELSGGRRARSGDHVRETVVTWQCSIQHDSPGRPRRGTGRRTPPASRPATSRTRRGPGRSSDGFTGGHRANMGAHLGGGNGDA